MAERKQSAEIDYLTGDLNRRGMHAYFQKLDEQESISFMFLDIDNFKSVNDTYGHSAGDKLLEKVSENIRGRIRDAKLVRFGGDEFVIMIPQKKPEEDILRMAEDILGSVSEIDINMEIRSIISFSIGIVMNQKKSAGLDFIMAKCDAAMYEAKKRGKNCYVLYRQIEENYEKKKLIEQEKNQALIDEKFEVMYLPVMNLSASSLVAAKATFVWNRGTERWEKEVFQEVLEEDGFIIELERYAFSKVCNMLAKEKESAVSRLPIIFPVSSINVNRVNFLLEIEQEVERYGLSREQIVIHIDRISSRMDERRVRKFFDELRNAGFRTSINGYGEASSTLTLIKDLPLDYVDMGSSFLKGLYNGKKEELFIKNILNTIEDLNLEAIVNGVEDATQVRYLNSFGCSLGAGSKFSEQLSEEEYRIFTEKNAHFKKNHVRFEFRGNLLDTTKQYKGKYIGTKQGERYVFDKQLGKHVLYLSGGAYLDNALELPVAIMQQLDYSIELRFKQEKCINWSSLLYVLYEDGFMSFMPSAWSELSMYRIKDDLNENGWHDVIGKCVTPGWHTVVMTYNHKANITRMYMDGEICGCKDNVICLKKAKSLFIGGDIYAPAFTGYLDYIDFYDYVLDGREINQIFDKSLD